MESVVREGFLCPICMQDLGSYHKLQNHFETSHTAEDKAVFNQIKGLFTKAKGRILGREGFSESSAGFHTQSHTPTNLPVWEPQEFGVTRSHVERFKKIRDARIDRFVIESNKVLIRLDKLLILEELDKAKRKEYEKTLVPWVNDDNVPYCPTCGVKFNVTRRKHHCRLCGAIMCAKCSLFISYDLADELVKSLKKPLSARTRSHSINMPNGTRIVPNHVIQIRSCHDCYKILLQRKNKTTERSTHQLLVLLYEKLQSSMQSANKTAPEYERMAESLNQGEEDFGLEQATKMRLDMMKYYETIDVVSKKIAALDTNDEENPPSPNSLRLQVSIRQSAHAYLQENMLALQSLPSAPKLETLRKQRRKQREKKLREQMLLAEQERAEAKRLQELQKLQQERDIAEADRKMGLDRKKLSPAKSAQVAFDKGWSSTGFRSRVDLENENFLKGGEADPLLEQINNVRLMLQEAKDANRMEEAESLKINLEELKKEYNKRLITAFASDVSTGSPTSSPSRSINPFLEDSEVNMRKVRPSNPFFVDTDDDSKNPFVEKTSTGTNPFEQDSDSSPIKNNPILIQMNYVKQCLDKAVKSGNRDEARMLRENLKELNALYNE